MKYIQIKRAGRNGNNQREEQVPAYYVHNCGNCGMDIILMNVYAPQPCRNCNSVQVPCGICNHQACHSCPLTIVSSEISQGLNRRGLIPVSVPEAEVRADINNTYSYRTQATRITEEQIVARLRQGGVQSLDQVLEDLAMPENDGVISGLSELAEEIRNGYTNATSAGEIDRIREERITAQRLREERNRRLASEYLVNDSPPVLQWTVRNGSLVQEDNDDVSIDDLDFETENDDDSAAW
jgi:hypothetical protein